LQVLDDGRLTDNKGRVADFKNTIIIMTSNIGSHLIQENYDQMKEGDEEKTFEKSQGEVMELLRQTIRPEFLNRIDEVIMFRPISRSEIKGIIQIQLAQLDKLLAKQNIVLESSSIALDYLAKIGYDPQYGARPLKRIIQKRIMNALSKEILAGKIQPNTTVKMDVFDDEFVFF
jgi:ATP-dependent Clp protease ATP-binding subunit ClpB